MNMDELSPEMQDQAMQLCMYRRAGKGHMPVWQRIQREREGGDGDADFCQSILAPATLAPVK